MLNDALEGPIWTTPTLTWSFAPVGAIAFTSAIGSAYQAPIRTAVAQWAAVTRLGIQEVAPGTPGTDLTIGWGSFTGSQIGETEYSYSSGSAEAFLPGTTIQIEDPALHALGTAPGATYLGTSTTLAEVALHEFGHALGLGHSTDPTAIMYPNLGPNNAAISQSDIAAINTLYGTRVAGTSAHGAAAPAAPGTIALTANQIGVYRFFDTSSGTQFLTASIAEANSTIASRPDLTYEGLGMAGITSSANNPATVAVYRFFDVSNGTHFFTASQTEEATIAATRHDLVLEQSTFAEHATQQAGDVAVYRFFDTHDGTHFFTNNDSERSMIASTRADMTYEGIAFYAPATS